MTFRSLLLSSSPEEEIIRFRKFMWYKFLPPFLKQKFKVELNNRYVGGMFVSFRKLEGIGIKFGCFT